MAVEAKPDFGRHLYGAAAIVFGASTCFWHDLNDWQQIKVLGNFPHRETVVYLAAAAALIGGIVIQWRRTAQLGAVVLGALYLCFALFWIPRIVAAPLIYDRWGNLFEQLSIFSGALLVYASLAPKQSPASARVARLGRMFFGVCVISFALEQAFYLHGTADFIPKWIPWHMFWAIATTVAFALAAVAILSGRQALLASRLLTAMILLFGVLIWLPALLADPHDLANWAGNAENFAIAGSAWILADYLAC